jgi:hypothetical protein
MENYSVAVRQVWQLELKEVERLKQLLPRYEFKNNTDKLVFYLNHKSEKQDNIDVDVYEFLLNSKLNTPYNKIPVIKFQIMKTKADKENTMTVITDAYSSTHSDMAIRRNLSSLVNKIMEYIEASDIIIPPSILPSTATARITFTLFNKNFVILAFPNDDASEEEKKLHINTESIAIKLLKGSTPPEWQQSALYANMDKAPHVVVKLYQGYGQFDHVDDCEAIQLISPENVQKYGFTISPESKQIDTAKAFELLKKEKIIPIIPVSMDQHMTEIQSIGFAQLILHEINTNPLFSTSNIVLG